jgi:hypothetical protein
MRNRQSLFSLEPIPGVNLNASERSAPRLRFCSSGLHRQTGFPPCRPASGEGASFLPSGLFEFLRHTGAGRFVRSGAVGDEPRLLFETQFPRAFGDMVGRHPHRPLRLKIAVFDAALGARVEDRNRLFRSPQAA